MICRLCLCNLSVENAIVLFGGHTDSKLAVMITKYFDLEISQDDPISTYICQDCCEHIEDFHKFWTYVDAKQSTLRNEFLEVKCDVALPEDSADAKLDGNGIEQQEMLLDFKDVTMLLGNNNEAAVTALENVEEDVKVDLADIDFTDLGENYSSSDDDVPLQALKTKVKKKPAKVKKYKGKKGLSKGKARKYIKKEPREKIDNAANDNMESAENDSKAAIDEDDVDADTLCSNSKSKTKVKEPKTYSSNHLKKLQHADIISQSMTLGCDLCDYFAKNYYDLRAHFVDVHKCPPYVKCCGKKYNKPSILAEHIQFHQNPAAFQCDICGKNLRSSKCLAVHKEIRHFRKHEPKPTVSCPKCPRKFQSQLCLDKHIIKHDNEQVYPCQICDKVFATPQRLRKHIEAIHDNIYHHVCDVCGKKFKFKPSFEKHMQAHSGIIEPTAQCDICGQWLKNKQALRLHQFRHDKRDTECKYCGRVCVSRTALRGHISYMHKKGFDLKCKFCEKTFKEVRNLEEHMAIHTGVQLYSCPHCSKECRSRSNMYVHVKRYHVQEWIKSKMIKSNDPHLKQGIEAIQQ